MKALYAFRNRDRFQRKHRALLYIAAFLVLITTYTLLYQYGMATYEDRPRPLIQSFQTVVETMTTTGYGEDAPWTSTPMNLLMILMQFSGILAIFLTLPLFVVPWIEEAMSAGAPHTVPEMEDHVVIAGTDTTARTLIDECTARDLDYLLIEPDEEAAVKLRRTGVNVITGDLESATTLRNAYVQDAKVVVTDASDETTASIVLSLRDIAPGVDVVSLVENPTLSSYISYAGANTILSPRHLLGLSLADKVATTVTAELGGAVTIGEDLHIVELPVQRKSPVAGTTLAGSGLWQTASTAIIGAWLRGEFVTAPGPETFIDEQSVLLVAGSEEQLEELRDKTHTDARSHTHGNVIIAGYGEVGSTVDKALQRQDIKPTVVDQEEMEEVDVVGDAMDEEVLDEAGIEEADVLIIAVSDDTTAIFTTLVARKVNPGIEIVVRANEADNIGKLYRAGADYVLSLETVSGRMIARNILGEKVLDPGTQIKLVRATAPKLIGKPVNAIQVREKTGCTLVAVERNGRVITDLNRDFPLQAGDEVIVAGTDEKITRFNDEYGD